MFSLSRCVISLPELGEECGAIHYTVLIILEVGEGAGGHFSLSHHTKCPVSGYDEWADTVVVNAATHISSAVRSW